MTDKEKYLSQLKKQYPTQEAVAAEIINLEAIISMPKGTEHFVSDIHGEYDAFYHLVNTCSGVIREKVDLLYKGVLSDKECAALASLISYPRETIDLLKQSKKKLDDWYMDTMPKLIHILLRVASKYTRSKVRKSAPAEFSYIINELLNATREGFDYDTFCNGVYKNIIKLNRAPAFIEAVSATIKKLAVVNLHIVGDIFDRGEHADKILDMLIDMSNVDIQWGNHDILWIGAGLGNAACIANILYIALKAGDVSCIEDGYGISLRRLEEYARKYYEEDERFVPNNENLSDRDKKNYAKMRKAIFYIMLKLEAEIIERNPEYEMDDRILLKRINKKDGSLTMPNGEVFYDDDFKTDHVELKLTDSENAVIEHLISVFRNSEKLQKHIAFLMKSGGLYKICNGNLLYHGCVPFNDDGTFVNKTLRCGTFSGKAYFDACEKIVRRAYANMFTGHIDDYDLDFCWYLWCGPMSPLFGRSKIATFERVYLPKEYGVEIKNPCYEFTMDEKYCDMILENFGVDPKGGHIINGHVPVKQKNGESPIKANGKLLVIDGGFCKAYQATTGIAGYTLIFNSYGLRLSAHESFGSREEAVAKCLDIHSQVNVLEHVPRRLTVADTDQGRDIIQRIEDLRELLDSGLL